MRRPLSILIVALFVLAPLSALLPGAADAQLPACCRRHGAHHCAMAALATAPAGTPQFTAPSRCPLYYAGHLTPSPVFTLLRPPSAFSARTIAAVGARPILKALSRPRIPSTRGPPSAC